MKKEIFVFILIFFLSIFQTISFFPFNFLLLALFFALLFLSKNFSIFLAIFTGLFLDLFSEKPFYFYTSISLLIFLFTQFLIKKYVKV